jgi:hypothetical protein
VILRNTTAGMTISDHALVRFIERVKGVSLDCYREEIAALISPAERLSVKDLAGTEDDCLAVIELGNSVVTILGRGHRLKASRQWGTSFVPIAADEPVGERTAP